MFDFLNKGSEKEMERLGQRLDTSSSYIRQHPPPTFVAIPERFEEPLEEVRVNTSSETKILRDSTTMLRKRDHQLVKLENEHNKLVKAHEVAVKENQGLKEWTAQLVHQLEAMRRMNNSLEQELQACKDDLFSLQPTAKVPDSNIARAYDELHVHISSWVEGEIALFETKYRDQHQRPLPNFFHHGGMSAAADFLAANPDNGGEYLVCCLLQYLLQRMVFGDNILLLGLDASETALLRRIEQGMSMSKPPQGDYFS
ncbi:MAG: hypothetical protein Q9209_002764 [Squamulea sp. 1 TL-2023]